MSDPLAPRSYSHMRAVDFAVFFLSHALNHRYLSLKQLAVLCCLGAALVTRKELKKYTKLPLDDIKYAIRYLESARLVKVDRSEEEYRYHLTEKGEQELRDFFAGLPEAK